MANEAINNIPCRLQNIAVDGHVAGTSDIIDDELGKSQAQINTEIVAAEQNLDNRLGVVEQLAEISIGGGDAQIATGSDFNNPTTAQRAKVTTVGSILDGADDVPTAGSDNLVKSGGVFEPIKQLSQETTGNVITQFKQATILGTTGKYDYSARRVVCLSAINTGYNVRVTCTGDVKINGAMKFTATTSPIDGGVKNTDWKEIGFTNNRDFTFVFDASFPNLYVIFARYSDNTQNIDIQEVSENVQMYNSGSIDKRLSTAEETLSNMEVGIIYDVSAANNNASYTLSTAIAAIPVNKRKGGMIIKFIDSDKGKYSYYKCVADTFKTNANSDIVYWESVDNFIETTDQSVFGTFYFNLGMYVSDNIVKYTKSTVRVTTGWIPVTGGETIKIQTNRDVVLPYYVYYFSGISDINPTSVYVSNNSIQLSSTFTVPTGQNISHMRLIFSGINDADISALNAAKNISIKCNATQNTFISELFDLKDKVNSIVPEDGNATCYGRKQTLIITNESHKVQSELVVSHLHSAYQYTTMNQSIAVWNGKCFCFNDNQTTYGFCVVLDVSTGSVIYRVADTPSVVLGSHLNNACFTDQYYDSNDTYPLLLLSRGDYANTINKKNEELYIFRITESNNTFVFTLIKTIIAQHDFLTTFNPSFIYDANRKMIWCYSLTEDWRWIDWDNRPYRKFSGTDALFKAYGASYVCVESGVGASVSANITITVGSTTRTIAVAQGEAISEVFQYSENAGGTCLINCSQSANAYSGLYYVYSCDQNGNNKKLIKCLSAIVGFQSPDLTDGTTITIPNSDFTEPVYIDTGIFQGGCHCNGKLYLPYHNYRTINNEPVNYLGRVCLVVNPTNGYIESILKLSSSEEPEGCAIYDGNLYISHHNGAATAQTTTPAFELYKYTF